VTAHQTLGLYLDEEVTLHLEIKALAKAMQSQNLIAMLSIASSHVKRTHEQEDDVGSNSRKLDGTGMDSLHQDVTVLIPLVHIPGLALDDVLFQYSYDLQVAEIPQK
jgi:hypothetical protein